MTKFYSLIFLSLLTLLIGCDSTKTTSTNSSSNTLASTSCTGNYYYCATGCGGYSASNAASSFCTGYTTSGSTSGTTTTTTCTGTSYYCNSACAGYSTTYANSTYCKGSTTTVNYGVKYPGGIPTGSGTCTTTGSQSYSPRSGTIMAAGGYGYDPYNSITANYYNTSSLLKTVAGAKTFFVSDSVLKVRFKVNPQPDAAGTTDLCYGRATGASVYGYTKLSFYVTAKGYDSNGNITTESLGNYVVGVNDCSAAIDLSSLQRIFTGGMWIQISTVRGNQNCSSDSGYNNSSTGFTGCEAYKDIRSMDCWTMDIQVAADDTKQFP